MEDIGGKNVLITGASSGIGAALAREFARRGANLILAARRTERLDTLAEELSGPTRKALACRCDVTRDGDMEHAVALALETFGSLDIVIANAGFGVVGSVEELTLDSYRRQFETNIYGVLRTAKAALPELKKSKGRIAIVGSVNGYIALAGNSAYAMSKFAVRALADSLRAEMAPLGVSVTHIAPGFVTSEIRLVDNEGHLHAGVNDPIVKWIRMPADRAARDIAKAVIRRRSEAVITGHGKLLVWLFRHFPRTMFAVFRVAKISARAEPHK